MNDQGLGTSQRKALEFISAVNGWHTFAPDVRRVVLSLEARGLVEVSHDTQQFRRVVPMTCNQCQMVSINGIPCHEHGCPNSRSRYDATTGEWIKQRVCFDCGCTVDAEDACCQSDELQDDVEIEEAEDSSDVSI